MTSNADCEWGFHLMNSIKTKQRNRMDVVRIKNYLQSNGVIDFDCVYKAWVQAKDRREKK